MANIIKLCEQYSSVCPLVDSRYRLVKPVGESRFGKVYLCLDTKLSKIVAFKELKKNNSNYDSLKMFLNEMKNLAKLVDNEYKNYICGLLDFNFEGITDSGERTCYYVMEYKAMGDLYSLIDSYSDLLSEKLAGHFFLQILNALNKIHDKGIVHLDIKPENIVLDEKLNIYLCDFGHSFDVHSNTTNCRNRKNIHQLKKRITEIRKKSFIGSENYSSPEINNFQEDFDSLIKDHKNFIQNFLNLDFYKCDVYSAGITFFVIFFKAIPPLDEYKFYGKKQLDKDFWEECSEVRSVDEGYINLFSGCCFSKPSKRYSVKDVLDDCFFDDNQFYEQETVCEEMEDWIKKFQEDFLEELHLHLEKIATKFELDFRKNNKIKNFKSLNISYDKMVKDFAFRYKKDIENLKIALFGKKEYLSGGSSSSSSEDYTFN